MKCLMLAIRISDGKIRPEFRDAYSVHLIQNTQLFQNGQVHWQQGLADMKSGVFVLFQQSNSPSSLCGQVGKGRSRWTTPYNEYIGLSRHHAEGNSKTC